MENSTNSNKSLLIEGLWTQNPGLVKLLGLCPLLAVSNSAVNAIGLGIATLFTLLVSNTLVSVFRHHIHTAIRIPLYVLIIATTVTIVELLMRAWFPGMFAALGIFLPLIVTNCLIIGRAEAFASRQSVKQAFIDGLAMGLGFFAVLLILGSAREIIGQGSWLSNANLLFGDLASTWKIEFFDRSNGVLLALLPPGAFIGLGLMLAVKNAIDASLKTKRDTVELLNQRNNQQANT